VPLSAEHQLQCFILSHSFEFENLEIVLCTAQVDGPGETDTRQQGMG
jgi:hypothetical protein